MGFLPLPVTCGTSQELSHPSSCQGHQSSAGSGALLHRCQLLSSGGASRKVSRFIQELFCFGTVRGVFSLALTFFFFLTEVVCVSPWHFPSKQLHQKIPDQPSPHQRSCAVVAALQGAAGGCPRTSPARLAPALPPGAQHFSRNLGQKTASCSTACKTQPGHGSRSQHLLDAGAQWRHLADVPSHPCK